MGYIENYNDFSEKENFFTQRNINTKTEFDAFLSQLKPDDSIWRGAVEAKHKIYNSLQRFWIINDLQESGKTQLDFILKSIDVCEKFQTNLFQRFFGNTQSDFLPTIYTYLSILRHHNTPSPLLDWTLNPRVALFFGSESDDLINTKSTIENYFSLYRMLPEHPYYKLSSKETIKEFIEISISFKEQYNSLRLLLLQNSVNEPLLSEKLKKFEIDFGQGFLTRLDDFVDFFKDYNKILKIQDKSDDDIFYNVNTNYNIINQEGLFILSASESDPLEEAILKRHKELLDDYAHRKNISVDKKEQIIKEGREINKSSFICYNIHKSLRKYILKKIAEPPFNITREFLFPNLYELGKLPEKIFLENL